MSHVQDWDTVVIRGPKGSPSPQQAKGKGSTTYTHQAATARRIENDPEAHLNTKRKELSAASRQEMMQRRTSLGLTQVQLNQRCAFPLHTIREIEAGRICPSPQQLSIINRVYGSKLVLS